jgi:hypothetical protein
MSSGFWYLFVYVQWRVARQRLHFCLNVVLLPHPEGFLHGWLRTAAWIIKRPLIRPKSCPTNGVIRSNSSCTSCHAGNRKLFRKGPLQVLSPLQLISKVPVVLAAGCGGGLDDRTLLCKKRGILPGPPCWKWDP